MTRFALEEMQQFAHAAQFPKSGEARLGEHLYSDFGPKVC